MKEKIKNFLLKIKNFFNEKHTFTFIQLVVIAILINFITMFLSFMEIKALDLCFNETHTEQIEETPQTESIRIEKELKFANTTYLTYADLVGVVWYLKPINDIDVNLTFDDTPLLNTVSNNVSVGTLYLSDGTTYDIKRSSSSSYVIYCASFDIDLKMFNIYNPITLAGQTTNISNSYIVRRFVGSSFIFNNVDVTMSATFINGWLKYFTDVNPNPTLGNAPSSLVNTIPSNVVTTLPSNLGTKVYDSGSAWVQDPNTFSEYDGFGYQIYYKADILTSETDLLRFTIDGVTYRVEPNIYRYYLREVYFVIYTLWDNTPIYYVSDNILDTPFPFTLDYETRFNISDLINWLSVRVDIVDTYSDYLHIRFNYDYFMRLTHSDEFVWLIDEQSEYFDALIFSTADKPSIIKNDGFMLNVIPELDPKFAKMGQSQTDNMYSTIVHGGTINQVWSNAYNKGVDVGNANGYSNGYNDGIETGKTLQNPLNPIMDFISDGALVISNVFSFEILPNISLGTLLLFPLAIALIWFVIKLFMGG